MTMLTVVCVLRSGGDYLPEHVYTLRDGVEKWMGTIPYRFICLSDLVVDGVEVIPLLHGWHRWWSKLELFRPALDGVGDFLYFDLDTVIVGDLRDIAEAQTLTVLGDFYRLDRIGSGLMYIPASERPLVWQRWASNPQVHMRNFRGDQEFLDPLWRDKAERWQALVPGQVISYKVHVQRAGNVVPPDARVVCFHGRPRPWQVKEMVAGSTAPH